MKMFPATRFSRVQAERRSRRLSCYKTGYKERQHTAQTYLHVDIDAGSLTSAIDLLFNIYNLCSIREISSIVGQFGQRSLKSAAAMT